MTVLGALLRRAPDLKFLEVRDQRDFLPSTKLKDRRPPLKVKIIQNLFATLLEGRKALLVAPKIVED